MSSDESTTRDPHAGPRVEFSGLGTALLGASLLFSSSAGVVWHDTGRVSVLLGVYTVFGVACFLAGMRVFVTPRPDARDAAACGCADPRVVRRHDEGEATCVCGGTINEIGLVQAEYVGGDLSDDELGEELEEVLKHYE